MSDTSSLEFYDLSHPWGFQAPNWPYFQDVQIERIHYMAKSGVLTQKITTTMHSTTHIDAPAHVVEGTQFIDEVPLEKFFGTGVVVSIPKGNFEMITADDLENATPKIQRGDVVIINTGWHKDYSDSQHYFGRCPGLVPSAAHWLVERGVKVVGHDTQANDHPLATAIGPHGPGGGVLMPEINKEYEKLTGRKPIEDFPEWEPVHRILFSNGKIFRIT